MGKDLLEFSSPSDPRGGQVWQPSQNNSCGMVSNRSVGFWEKKKLNIISFFFFKEKKDLGDLAGQKLRDISVIRLSKKARNEQ